MASYIQHELVHAAPPSSAGQDGSPWTLFPAPARRTQSKSLRLPARKPLKAPPPSPRNLGPAYILNQNAERLAEVCRIAPAEVHELKRRNLSVSSQESVPGMTDDHTDSDASLDEERYQTCLAQTWDMYHEISSSTRVTNHQVDVFLPSKKQIQPLDRTWASDLTATLDIPMPSPGSPAFPMQMQFQQDQMIQLKKQQTETASELQHAASLSNLQRSPARRRTTRRHPDVLSTIPYPFSPAPTIPRVPVLTTTEQHPVLRTTASTVTLSNKSKPSHFETWPPRSDSSITVPTRKAFVTTKPTLTCPNFSPLSPTFRPSTAPSQKTTITTSSSPLPPLPFPPAAEKSVWDYDDDDDEKTSKGHAKGEGSLSKLMHVRGLSNGNKKMTVTVGIERSLEDLESEANKDRGGKPRNKRTASEVLRGVFGLSKKL